MAGEVHEDAAVLLHIPGQPFFQVGGERRVERALADQELHVALGHAQGEQMIAHGPRVALGELRVGQPLGVLLHADDQREIVRPLRQTPRRRIHPRERGGGRRRGRRRRGRDGRTLRQGREEGPVVDDVLDQLRDRVRRGGVRRVPPSRVAQDVGLERRRLGDGVVLQRSAVETAHRGLPLGRGVPMHLQDRGEQAERQDNRDPLRRVEGVLLDLLRQAWEEEDVGSLPRVLAAAHRLESVGLAQNLCELIEGLDLLCGEILL